MTPGPKRAASGVVLVVEDDSAFRRTCERYLTRLGHQVRTASGADEAIERILADGVDVVVTDLQMPGGSGLKLLGEIHIRAPGTRTILMSGMAQATDAAAAIERGVDRLLLKPFDLEELRAGVEKALAEKRAQENSAREREGFESLIQQRESESRLWILRAAHALATAVEAKDAYTAGHTSRVTAYARVIAEAVGDLDVARVQIAGDLHDVGKIGVPDAVLNKPGRLTDDEFGVIQRHPQDGARILEPLIEDPLILGVVRWHHERWDGRGYPDGLQGESIPLPARVLAVADTLDAMTSRRAYREALPWEVATAEIRRNAGSQFDPRVVEAFDAALPKLAALYESF